MQTVKQYGVKLVDLNFKFDIDMPIGAKILDAKFLFNDPVIWAAIDTEEKKTEKRYFETMLNDKEMDKDGKYRYITTFQIRGGQVVFHLFEVIKKKGAKNVD